jgi:hypothetical protein
VRAVVCGQHAVLVHAAAAVAEPGAVHGPVAAGDHYEAALDAPFWCGGLYWPWEAVMSHPAVVHPHESLNNRLGDRISGAFGSMRTFWVLVAWQLGWMLLAGLGAPLIKNDPYPFVFLLFLSNLIQLWALPVLGNTQNRADEKRNLKADTDHTALTHIAITGDATQRQVAELHAFHIEGRLPDRIVSPADTGAAP